MKTLLPKPYQGRCLQEVFVFLQPLGLLAVKCRVWLKGQLWGEGGNAFPYSPKVRAHFFSLALLV